MKAIEDRALVLRFALGSLVVFIIVAGVLAWTVTQELRTSQERAAEFHAEFVVDTILAPELRGLDLGSLSQDESQRLVRLAENQILGFPVHRLLVWDRSGRILVSTDSAVSDAQPSAAFDPALKGSTFSQVSRDPVHEDMELYVTYAPIELDDGVVAIAEVHQEYRAIQSAVRGLFSTVVTTMLAGLAILYVLLLPIARKTSATLRSRNRELKLSEGRFRSLVQNSSDVVCVLDPTGVVTYVSPSVSKVFGHHPSDLIGDPITDLIHHDDQSKVFATMSEVLSEPGTAPSIDCRWRNDKGEWKHGESIFTNLIADPSVSGIVVNTRDVTAKVLLQREWEAQVFKDPLTGLANRALFRERLAHTVVLREQDSAPMATLFLDIDDFKSVNDAHGHSVGDELLKQAATRLTGCLRPGDTAARFSGDEFALLLEEADRNEAAVVADRVIEALSEPFLIGDREIRVAASIGVVVGHGGEDVESLLRNADLAMYAAKHEGKNRFRIFEPAMHEEVVEHLQLVSDLRQAIEDDDFHVAYQPFLSLAEQSFVGVEALARWDHPTRGPLPPSVFIPVAEETGLITGLGRLILRTAVQQGSKWAALSAGDFMISVNLSARQLLDPELVPYVEELLSRYGLEPSSLLLEITESQIMRDIETVIARLNSLKAVGVKIAVDDFGTGQTSLSQLGKLPLDVLKIDRSFVTALGQGVEELAVVQAIIRISQSYNYITIAEGVEEPSQVSELLRLGVDIGQGFMFSRPVPADVIEKRYLSAVAQAV